MSTEEVFMDIPQVQDMAKQFNAFSEILNAAAIALQAISISLKATAWLSLGATYAAAMYIDRIQPNVKKAGEEMKIISGDITSAINAYQTGDVTGSNRFI
jgi:hypothetical protein